MKKNKKQIIVCAIIVLFILGLIGFYIYEVAYLKKPYDENLFRMIAIVCGLIATLIRCTRGVRRNNLDFYESAYEKDIRYAFKDNPVARKKLLCAIRLYNENNFKKSVKYLAQLRSEIRNEHDAQAVYLFAAMCHSDSGLNKDAIQIYYELLKVVPSNTTAHNNLGHLYLLEGDYDMALQHLDKAIECDPYDNFAYINKANFYFKQHDLDNAATYAEKALELKNNDDNSSGLLAIIYALKNDEEKREKYFHIAITNGKNPDDLKAAIEYYLKEKDEFSTKESEDIE